MIAIPNMKKPKRCLECWSGLSIAINCEAGADFWNPNGDRIPPDCPIIEIDEKAFNEVIKGYLEGLKAIQNGERTSNDTD